MASSDLSTSMFLAGPSSTLLLTTLLDDAPYRYDVRDETRDVRNLGKPVELAGRYFEEGADEVTFLNITSFRNSPLKDQPMLEVSWKEEKRKGNVGAQTLETRVRRMRNSVGQTNIAQINAPGLILDTVDLRQPTQIPNNVMAELIPISPFRSFRSRCFARLRRRCSCR